MFNFLKLKTCFNFNGIQMELWIKIRFYCNNWVQMSFFNHVMLSQTQAENWCYYMTWKDYKNKDKMGFRNVLFRSNEFGHYHISHCKLHLFMIHHYTYLEEI